MKHMTAVAGVVVRDPLGLYLMVQERQEAVYGLWNLPAGHVDEGESEAQAAIREAKEETGYDIELIDVNPIFVERRHETNRTFFAFSAKVIGGEMKIPQDELLDAKWLPFNSIVKLNKEAKIRSDWQFEAISKVENAYSRD